MLAVNISAIDEQLKDYMDEVAENDETVIVTRDDNKPIVIISLDEYNQMARAARNAAYLDKIDRAMAQLAAGKGTVHDLVEADDE